MAKIPKIIHYSWFGPGKMNDVMQHCMDTWKQILPEYEVRVWNEENVDLDICPYVRDSYDEGNWSFVSDYFRVYALIKEGGIYLDTDVEILKPLDKFLDNDVFATFKKTRSIFGVSAAVVGAVPGYKHFVDMMDIYNNLSLYDEDGSLHIATASKYMADLCEKLGIKLDGSMQSVDGFTMYPMDYLSPEIDMDGNILQSENTHAIHHYCNSWLTDEIRQKLREAYQKREKGQVQLK